MKKQNNSSYRESDKDKSIVLIENSDITITESTISMLASVPLDNCASSSLAYNENICDTRQLYPNNECIKATTESPNIFVGMRLHPVTYSSFNI